MAPRTRILVLLTALALGAAPLALAKSWTEQDQPGSGWQRQRQADGAWIERYDDGNCKVERKRDKTGAYQETVDCKRTPASGRFYVPR